MSMKFGKNYINNFLFVSMMAVGMSSCNFLDTEPYDFVAPETFFNTEEECEMALAGIYWTLASESVYGENYSCKLSNTDDLSFYTRANQTDNVATNSHGTGNAEIWNVWEELYSGINNANILLENIDNSGISDEKTKNRIKGEAKFLRAYYHFLLIQGWYEVPLRKASVDDIMDSPIESTPYPDALDWVIQEMDDCIELVDDEDYDLSPSHVKKTVVQGILARVCLFRAGWPSNGGKPYYEKARDYALAVKTSDKHHLIQTEGNPDNIYLLWKNLAQDKYDTEYNESMWEVEYIGNKLDGRWTEGKIGANIGNLQQNSSQNGFGYCYAFYSGSLVLWDLFDDGDLRRDLCMAPYKYDKTDQKVAWKDKQIVNRTCGKFRREWENISPKHKNNTQINYPLLRYADVLLMLAEAENEVNEGPTALAYECINAVRTRAGITELSGLDYDGFKKELQDERGRELCFESLRKFDLVRWGIYYDRIKNVMGNLVENDSRWGTGTYQLAPSQYVKNTEEKHVFFPIPLKELSVNKLLEQNVYWK